MDSCSYDSSFYNGTWIIVPEDLTVVITFRGHYGGSDLAQAYAMAPSRAMQDDPVPLHLHIECRALEMTIRKDTPDFQLLADSQSLFRADDPKLEDPS